MDGSIAMTPKDTAQWRTQISDLIPCLDSWCNKNGTTMNGSAEEPEPAQCQYCYEVRFPAIDSILALLATVQAETIDKLIDGLSDDFELVKSELSEDVWRGYRFALNKAHELAALNQKAADE